MSSVRKPIHHPPYKQSQRADHAEIKLLIEQYPLAWVCAASGDEACLLPLIGDFDRSGRLIGLIGHYALANPLGKALERDHRVTVLFSGPQGYVSPSDAERRNWGPTWNFAQIHMRGTISIEPELTEHSLALLVDHVEKVRPDRWHIEELGERYELLMRHIVGFRIEIQSVCARFKLGQDEKLHDLRNILSNLRDGELKDWMVRSNRNRLPMTEVEK